MIYKSLWKWFNKL